jgi:magnesium transporter
MVTIYDYDTTKKSLVVLDGFPERFELRADHRYWIDLEGSLGKKQEELKKLEAVLAVHPLTFEDLLEKEHRPKVEEFDEYLFILLHGVNATHKKQPDDPAMLTTELNIFFGLNFIVTAHLDPLKSVTEARAIVRQTPAWSRSMVYLLYTIIDRLVDEYVPVFDELEMNIDELGERALSEPEAGLLEGIIEYRRIVMFYKRIITPQREIFSKLSHSVSRWYASKQRVYFRDLYDHFYHYTDIIDTLREELDNAFNAYTAFNANRMNEVMKTLTVFASIILPLTVVTGIYGMNFKTMPELTHPLGYPGAIIAMLIIAGSLLYYFKRKGWV